MGFYAWRIQSLAEGDLSERARQRAAELARDADIRVTVPRQPKEGYDTCLFSMMREDESDAHSMPNIPLAEVIACVARSVRLLKLDCEGAEYAILDGVDLSQVQKICGEVHDMTLRGKCHGVDNVVASLASHPSIDHYKNGPTTWLFYTTKATR